MAEINQENDNPVAKQHKSDRLALSIGIGILAWGAILAASSLVVPQASLIRSLLIFFVPLLFVAFWYWLWRSRFDH